MNHTLVFAIVFINLAMVLYTVGVWAERIQRRLKWWHTGLFWAGLVCDTVGTTAMSMIGGALIKFNFHGMTGMTAILLMLFHATWATWVLLHHDEKRISTFHRFSIFVWIMWMIPMIGGMLLGAGV
ncbi:MAG: HsmA family protein [Bacteroidota bacterium]